MLAPLNHAPVLAVSKPNLLPPALYPSVWPTGFPATAVPPSAFPNQDGLKAYQRIVQ